MVLNVAAPIALSIDLNEYSTTVFDFSLQSTLDFTPGGIFHYRMEKDGQSNYGRFLFGRILPHDLLEFTNSFADENANVIAAPFNITLPKAIFYSLSFTDLGDKTVITLIAKPVEASKEEIEGFQAINESMQEGFKGTFDSLANYLAL